MGIRPDLIVGTSAGAIIGGSLASGLSIAELNSLAADAGYTNTMRPAVSLGGLLSTKPLDRLLRSRLPTTRFEEMKIPFAAVAYEIDNGKEAILAGAGDAVVAIRASSAVPGIFVPVSDESGRRLVDGAISSPLPARAARDLGADIVIAVDVIACGATFRSSQVSPLRVPMIAAMTLIRNLAAEQHRYADIVIAPQIAHLRPDQIYKRHEFISLGADAAASMRERILNVCG